jgi:hypothetical protein
MDEDVLMEGYTDYKTFSRTIRGIINDFGDTP